MHRQQLHEPENTLTTPPHLQGREPGSTWTTLQPGKGASAPPSQKREGQGHTREVLRAARPAGGRQPFLPGWGRPIPGPGTDFEGRALARGPERGQRPISPGPPGVRLPLRLRSNTTVSLQARAPWSNTLPGQLSTCSPVHLWYRPKLHPTVRENDKGRAAPGSPGPPRGRGGDRMACLGLTRRQRGRGAAGRRGGCFREGPLLTLGPPLSCSPPRAKAERRPAGPGLQHAGALPLRHHLLLPAGRGLFPEEEGGPGLLPATPRAMSDAGQVLQG